jgi:prepilin-type N-terminal cleavage/methylation domain-containing protein
MIKTTSGFTIVELIIATVIISILAMLGTYSFMVIQVDSRDSQRSIKISMIAEALEKYYDDKGEYPSCNSMSDTIDNVVANTLKSIKPDVLTAPTAAIGSNSIICDDMPTGYTLDRFAYFGSNSSDSSVLCSANSTAACLQWTLKYREEASGNIIPLNSRHRL